MTYDLISRQAAIKAIENLQDCYNGFSDTYDKACIIGALEDVPSAQPERKKGKWLTEYLDGIPGRRAEIKYCSECCQVSQYRYKFCPNCGAEMRGEQDGRFNQQTGGN